jgi:16S rRNA (guanine1207-N2)-methyltransferase
MREELLIQAAQIGPQDDVLDLGWDGRPVSAGVAAHCRSVTFLTADLREARALEDSAPEGGAAVRAVYSADVPEGPFTAVLYKPVRWAAKARVFELMQACFGALAPGGSLYLAGRRDAGVESYRLRLQDLFGKVDVLHRRAGMRVYRAEKVADTPGVEPAPSHRTIRADDLPGGAYTFETRAGVFSWDGVDPGTRLLLAHAAMRPGERVLDLGCGFGVLGIVASRITGSRTTLVDVDALAIGCARRNVAINAVSGASVVPSDGFCGLPGSRFDLVLSNPPTHQGARVALAFAAGSAAHLSPSGRLCVVVRRPQLYARPMRKCFQETCYLAESEGYTVIQSRYPAAA